LKNFPKKFSTAGMDQRRARLASLRLSRDAPGETKTAMLAQGDSDVKQMRRKGKNGKVKR
jgi:hypothetical protein